MTEMLELLTLDLFVNVLYADTNADATASDTLADRCSSRLFTVRSLTGHNGIVTALAMSDRVLITARCAFFCQPVFLMYNFICYSTIQAIWTMQVYLLSLIHL